MVTAALVALCLAVNAPSDDALVVFGSSTCPDCQSMEPALRRLAASGVRVERVDVAVREDLVRQFQVARVPTFVMWSQGRATGRIEGAASFDRLVQLTTAAQAPLGDRLAPPPPLQPNMPIEAPASSPSPGMVRGQSPDVPSSPTGAPPSSVDPRAATERALRSTVRLRIENAAGTSVASGTIIDVHDDEALVVTCGHVFRDLRRGGQIWVDLFVPGANQPVAGQLLDFDLQRDVGVVSIRPGVAVQAARVASTSFRPGPGDAVVSLGCDRGAPPTVRPSRVTAVDRYKYRPNIEIEGQPVQGRSGGGLFTSDGLLIGVCNGADPHEDRGVFAGLATIQWQLENIGQKRVFASEPAIAAAAAAPRGPAPAGASAPPPTDPAMLGAAGAGALAGAAAADSARSTPAARGLNPGQPIPVTPANFEPTVAGATLAARDDGDVELICVVRTRAGEKPETIVVRNPSPDLLQRLLQESRSAGARAASPVVRGQSSRGP